MSLLTDIPADLMDVQVRIMAGLAEVGHRFDRQLRSDLPPVRRLCDHVERYRGKMLRPTLVLACGLASSPAPSPAAGGGGAEVAAATKPEGVFSPAHITLAAVVEMIHMAALVHDDVLDESDTRRRGQTVNRLHGNETAVILGDYLIAAAYHLCSQLDSQKTALLAAHISMTLCAGELLQLAHRNDLSIDEPTYFEIIERKTGSLVALACRLGAEASAADESTARRFERFGLKIGVAFQIQDDLLDLAGRQAALGKPIGQDLAKGKLTLPLIHHLATVAPDQRGRSLLLLEQAINAVQADTLKEGGTGDSPVPTRGAGFQPAWTPADAASALLRALESSGSLSHARTTAQTLITEAKSELAPIPDSAAKRLLLAMADSVVARDN